MSDGAAVNLQSAVFALLNGTAALTSQLAAHVAQPANKGLYDYVPQGSKAEDKAAFPYVVIGNDTTADWDTDSSVGREVTLTLHTFSRYLGKKELKNIMDAIKAALHDVSLVVTGEKTVLCLQEFSETFLEDDGITRRGVQRFRIITEGT